MTAEPKPTVDMVALPVATLRLLVGAVIFAVLIMLAMLSVEIVILLQVFDLIDLIQQLVPPT